MEVLRSAEMWVNYKTTRHHIQGNTPPYSRRHQILKSNKTSVDLLSTFTRPVWIHNRWNWGDDDWEAVTEGRDFSGDKCKRAHSQVCSQGVYPIAPVLKVTHCKQLRVGFALVTHSHVSRSEQQKDKTDCAFSKIYVLGLNHYLVIAVNYSDSQFSALFVVNISTLIPLFVMFSSKLNLWTFKGINFFKFIYYSLQKRTLNFE